MSDITQYGQLKRDESNFPVGWKYLYMSATAGTIVKSSPGMLHTITFNKPTATTVITLCDNASSAQGTFGQITVPSSPQPVTLRYDVVFNNGLFVNMLTANSDITISYI